MTFRAGDVVLHKPTGETWILAVDEEDGEVCPGGWPETYARAADCEIVTCATDEQRTEELAAVARGCADQRRGAIAARQLGARAAS